jgi:hypothetical protein
MYATRIEPYRSLTNPIDGPHTVVRVAMDPGTSPHRNPQELQMPETKTKTIEGKNFEISQPYEEGHVITAIEARVLNQTRSENIGNNVRAKLKEAIEAGAVRRCRARRPRRRGGRRLPVHRGRHPRRRSPRSDTSVRPGRWPASCSAHLAESGRKLTVAPDGSPGGVGREDRGRGRSYRYDGHRARGGEEGGRCEEASGPTSSPPRSKVRRSNGVE